MHASVRQVEGVLMTNIVLCGFMGCGKTTVGKIIAQKAGYSFIDLDDYIEKKENKTVSEIFSVLGEEYFRRIEKECCLLLSQNDNTVLSLGGGTLMDSDNVSTFKKSDSVIVFLNTSLDTIKARLIKDTSRPLLARDDRDEYMQSLFNYRFPIYEKAADIIINSDCNDAEVTANEVIKAIKMPHCTEDIK